jgi:hypothetical protein
MQPCFFNSFRINLRAARLFLRDCARTSRTSPSSQLRATDMSACHQCGQKLHQYAMFLTAEPCAI